MPSHQLTPRDEPAFATEHVDDVAARVGMPPAAVDAFHRLLYACVPPKTYGQVRFGPATYRKFIATVWLMAPEVFDGMPPQEMAATLGMSERGLRKLVESIRLSLDSRKVGK